MLADRLDEPVLSYSRALDPPCKKEIGAVMTFESVNSVLEIRAVCTLTKEQLYEVLLDWSYTTSCSNAIGSLAMQGVEAQKDSRQTSLHCSHVFF